MESRSCYQKSSTSCAARAAASTNRKITSAGMRGRKPAVTAGVKPASPHTERETLIASGRRRRPSTPQIAREAEPRVPHTTRPIASASSLASLDTRPKEKSSAVATIANTAMPMSPRCESSGVSGQRRTLRSSPLGCALGTLRIPARSGNQASGGGLSRNQRRSACSSGLPFLGTDSPQSASVERCVLHPARWHVMEAATNGTNPTKRAKR